MKGENIFLYGTLPLVALKEAALFPWAIEW